MTVVSNIREIQVHVPFLWEKIK